MTLGEFLDWERGQELTFEFDGEQVIPISGESVAHNLIAGNAFLALFRQVDRTRTLVVQTVKLSIGGRVRYPDLIVANKIADTSVAILPEPIVVFEVVSPSSVGRTPSRRTPNTAVCRRSGIM